MLWVALALLSAFLSTVVSILEKKTLFREHSLQLSLLTAVFTTLISTVLLVFVDWGALELSLVAFIYALSWLSVLSNWFALKSMRHEELSSVIPLANLSPLILLLLAAFFLGESLTPLQLAGAVLMVLGVYVLEAAVYGSPTKLFNFAKAKYAWLMIVAVFIMAFCALGDKIALNAVSVISYILVIQFFLAVNYLFLFVAREGRAKLPQVFKVAKRDWHSIGAISVLTVINRLALATAISTAYVSLVITVKRLSTLFSTIAGGAFFNEKNIALKAAACGIMLAGVYFVLAH